MKDGLSPLREIHLTADADRDNLNVIVNYEPPCIEEQRFWVSHLNAQESRTIKPTAPKLSSPPPSDTQPVKGTIHVSVTTEEGETLVEQEHALRWLADSLLPDLTEYPVWLARTVSAQAEETDPIVSRITGITSTSGVEERVRAVWDALRHFTRDYKIVPPKDEQTVEVGCAVRCSLRKLKEQGYRGSLDAALLMISCLTRLRTNASLIITGRQALVGIFPGAMQGFDHAVQTDRRGVMKAARTGELTVLRAAGLYAPFSYENAAEEGAKILAEEQDDFLAVDVSCLLPEQVTAASDDDTEEAADLITAPESSDSRVDRWQRKLLDLSLRNNLLNTKWAGKNSLPLIVSGVAALENRLANGDIFRFKAQSGNDPADPDVQQLAASLLPKKQLVAAMEETDLLRRLGSLYLSARRELEESGSNTLYIACGFLKWIPKGAPADRVLRAPLILIPVQLSRASVKDGYALRSTDDEPRFNETLLELLRVEFSIRINELQDGELPHDESGLDVARILQTVRDSISRMDGWEVEEQCLLGLFSFAKFLMWQDLMARREQLLKNRVVQQLAAKNRGQFPEQVGFPSPDTLDRDEDPHTIYTPLPSDSSQLAAVLAAEHGKSFVLEGPPGTGKSQTIANMIAHCLGSGKTVLFVAEKAVALEVVHKRLTRIGLGDFCLQLHSNKTRLAEVIRQFRQAMEGLSAREQNEADRTWQESVDSMLSARNEVNELPQVMHRKYPDGLSLYEDICCIAPGEKLPSVKPTQEDPLALPHEERLRLLNLVHELAAHANLLQGDLRVVARDMLRADDDPEWKNKLVDALQQALPLIKVQEDILREWADLASCPDQLAEQRIVLFTSLEMAAEHPGNDWSGMLPRYAAHSAEVIRTLAEHADHFRRLRESLSVTYPDSAVRDAGLDEQRATCRNAQNRLFPIRWWSERSSRRYLRSIGAGIGKINCMSDLDALVSMRDEQRALDEADTALLPSFIKDKGTEFSRQDADAAQRLITRLSSVTSEGESLAIRLIDGAGDLLRSAAAKRCIAAWKSNHIALTACASQLTELLESPCGLLEHCAAGEAQEWLQRLLDTRERWRDVTLWNAKRREAEESGLGDVAKLLTDGECTAERIEDLVKVNLSRLKMQAAVHSEGILYRFSPALHEQKITDYSERDSQLRALTGERIRSILAQRAARSIDYEKEAIILQREITKKRGYMPLRKLLHEVPHVASLLKPCFLMSPLSIAQYLTPEAEPFDVVIFDEASQIPVWDAVGAIARGTSVIITGDSRQMPPTSFFGRSRDDEDEEDIDEPDLESILDECMACGVPKMDLTWHYRSKSESLISFSNAHYYEGKMTTFPAPSLRDTALCLHAVKGTYLPGAKNRTNPEEARAVVKHICNTLLTPGFRYTEATSIGVVTFNAQQQKLILDLLDDERAKHPSLEPFFAENNPEAVFVKNLENVQGDERGVIYFSTTYGRDADGHMSMNFGPLNLIGGERRLNVAVTRARYAMHIFTSMQPEDIDLTRTRARGAADLRDFLQYARSNSQNQDTIAETAAGVDPLAAHIASRLQKLGWRCRTGLGASDYRVDIAVEDPKRPNCVLAGITLDGTCYAAAHTARDRDIVRPDTMRLLGWRMLNVWAIDWWRNPEQTLKNIDSKLHEFEQQGPPKAEELPSLLPGKNDDAPSDEETSATPDTDQGKQETARVVEPGPEPTLAKVKPVKSSAFNMQPKNLLPLIEKITAAEAPITMQHLAARLMEIAPPGITKRSRAFAGELASFEVQVDQTARSLVADRKLAVKRIDSPILQQPQTIFFLPGEVEVLPRALGSRTLESIPVDELLEIARIAQQQLACLPGTDAHLRGISTFLRLPRLTQETREQLSLVIKAGARVNTFEGS